MGRKDQFNNLISQAIFLNIQRVIMNPFIESLKQAKANNQIQELNVEQLKEAQFLMDFLMQEAQAQFLTLTQGDAGDDPEYVELMIDGKKDRIKRDIETLNISCNNFTELPTAIYRLQNLKKLYLYNNRFSIEEKKKIRKELKTGIQIYF